VDEHTVREAVRSIIIDQQVVEKELTLTFVAALIRQGYGFGYLAAHEDPEPLDLEDAGKLAATLFCRLPV